MKKIIICLGIICLFLLSSIASSSTLTIANDGGDELDQYNEIYDDIIKADPNRGEYSFAQSFKPTYNILTRVNLKKHMLGEYTSMIRMTIKSDLNYGMMILLENKKF